jgi:FkbM family methyltransferase
MDMRARAGWVSHVWKATTQQHHKSLRGAFRRYIPRDAVVFDIGAHAGQFSKLFAKMAPDGRVYAFEPSAYARSVLVHALSWNRIGNVEIVPVGLSDTAGQLILTTPIKKRGGIGFGLAHLGSEVSERPTITQLVQLTTIDLFFEENPINRLDFIKADVEGWEYHILKGGFNALKTYKPALFLEVVTESLERAGSKPSDIWNLLSGIGYRSFHSPTFEPVTEYREPGDYLFIA